jgi:hypothetical protein
MTPLFFPETFYSEESVSGLKKFVIFCFFEPTYFAEEEEEALFRFRSAGIPRRILNVFIEMLHVRNPV